MSRILNKKKLNRSAEKIIVSESLCDLYDELEGFLDNIIARLKEMELYYINQGYSKIRIEEKGQYESYGLELWGDRIESDNEFKKRQNEILKELKKEEKKKEKELLTLKKLKEKYE